MTPVRAIDPPSREVFDREIRPAAEPVILRGLCRDWPLVRAAAQGSRAAAALLAQHAMPQPLNAVAAPRDVAGKLGYAPGLTALNFQRGAVPLAHLLERLLVEEGVAEPETFAIQSATIADVLPGLAPTLPMPLLGSDVRPRIWLGNRVTVATHRDPMENIAVVAAGRRRFTLFPPDQLPNLYLGPLEFTPAGAPVSLVDLDAPDFDRFPRFADALAHAQVAEMEPGDALYIPYFWWHHVQSIGTFNVLVNYWWNDVAASPGAPLTALLHALYAVRTLPADQRAAWAQMFDYFAFERFGPPAEHIPAAAQGVVGPPTPERVARMRATLKDAVSKL